MEDIRKQVSELTNQVVEFGRKMEADAALAQDTNILEVLERATKTYNKKELYALVSGEVKAGKSSLINSILGEDICTVNGGVCTNTNTLIRYGAKEKIIVYFASDKDDTEPEPTIISRENIPDYVSERKNKNNKKNVRLIVVELPNEHLKSGLVLIDTPGLGALNPLHAATTFSMAPMADVIILVASANSELKSTEVSYIERLLQCSKNKMVIHALTHSDQGDPETILTKNMEHLSAIKEWKANELQCCMVSNKNYDLYKQGKITDYSVTGFDKFFALLKHVEDNVENLMAERQLEQILIALQLYGNIINTLLNSFSSAEKMAEKKKQIEDAKQRLEKLTEESTAWKNQLGGEVKKLDTRVVAKIKQNYQTIKNSIEDKLLMDEYLKYPEQLGGIISSEIVQKSSELQQYLAEEFGNIYTWLKDETGLTLIQKEFEPINLIATSPIIGNVDIDKKVILRNNVLTNVFAYSLGGGIAGGFIGGIIGTFINPGLGTVAGAQIGARIGGTISGFIGGTVGLIKYGRKGKKEALRKKIMENVTPILNTSQSEMITKVQQIVIDAQTELTNAFSKELKNETAKCTNILKGLDSDSVKRKQISDLKRDCDKFQAKVATLLKAVKQ